MATMTKRSAENNPSLATARRFGIVKVCNLEAPERANTDDRDNPFQTKFTILKVSILRFETLA